MKMRIASTVLLCLLFAAFAFASPRQQDEPKAKEASPAMQHPEGKPEAKPETQEQKPEEMKPEKNDQEKQENKDAKEQEKDNKDRDKQEQKEENKSGKDDKNKNMGNMRDENHANARPAGKGGHIPDDKFRSNFGRGHTFHVSRPVIVNNQPTFNYGGYSFVMVEAWPVGWAYTDDCYVDYVDGEYFLFDVLHPGVRIALFVSL
jgi:hypothetical protein